MIDRINSLFDREFTDLENARNVQTKADALLVLDHLAMIANKYAEYELKIKTLNTTKEM